GYHYGPAFEGPRRAWRAGEEVFAEVALDSGREDQASGFVVHPALLDSALHALALAAVERNPVDELAVPFSFSGVRLHRRGACSLRVRLSGNAGSAGLIAFDEAGEAVLSIDSLQMRAIDRAALRRAGQRSRDLYALGWSELPSASPSPTTPRLAVLGAAEEGIPGIEADRYPDLAALEAAIEQGAAEPEMVLAEARTLVSETELPRAVHQLTGRTLELLKALLGSGSLQAARLVLITERALAVAGDEAPDLVQAALPGLMRSARAEHPDRFRMIDVDGRESARICLPGALMSEEPELAARHGRLYAPRVERLKAQPARAASLDHGTILLTGATGGLGALLARHIVSEHGARHLLLVSRSGPAATGAEALQAELEGLGCEVTLAGCDVTEREQLERLVASIPHSRPLRAVVHAAGVLDDGVISSLDGERLARVMAPKVDAAIHLHELTKSFARCELILYSSAAGILGAGGQGNYAAANTFMDALAAHRRAQGLPGLSLAWGAWETATGMTATLGGAGRARLVRMGLAPLSDTEGLALFDAARLAGRSLVLPWRLDGASLRAQSRAGTLPAQLRSLVRAPVRRAQDAGGPLARRLASAPESEWEGITLELVRGHVAAVLGHASAEAIDAGRAFKELGLDSLSAVELRNRLAQVTGMRLPATLVFGYPTPQALAHHLRERIQGGARLAPPLPTSPPAIEDPIAIVGASCRFPGGVDSPESLWALIGRGGDAISQFPRDRGWDIERLFDADPERPGTSRAREGGFLQDAADFDAGFFGISPHQADAIDPQQRLMLEVAWEALEDAGIDPASLEGSATAVFAGVSSVDHAIRLGAGRARELEGHLLTGAAASAVSGRVSYTLGLRGAAVTVDTACSSSLVALHEACRALGEGECSLALAGGVTVLSTPAVFTGFSRQGAVAADGRCKPFAAAADGAGFSEGAGLLVLERLQRARENGHRVLALVRASAVNQDGESNGFSAPNGTSQEEVIRTALQAGGLTVHDVDAVEGHGTGTVLGDPIEAQALIATYGQSRTSPLWLGSVKSNIGHTQAAAGVASVIKMVMAMRHGVLPRTMHVDRPSPHVEWQTGDVKLLTDAREWVPGERRRRAGISSFGISGTNAHVILEEPPAAVEPERRAPRTALPWLLSAKSESALRRQAERLLAHLELDPELEPLDVAYTLACGRARMEHRAAIVASGREDLLAGLGALSRGEHADGVITALAQPRGKVAVLFTGQGAQRAGMGSELYEAFPVFAESLDRICAELDGHLERPVKEILFSAEGSPEASLLDRTELTQPALFALEVALYRQLESAGVRPDLLIGHSIGELCAAHVAGVLSLEGACALVATRGRLMGSLPEAGAMAAVQVSEREAIESLVGFEESLSVAAVNGLRSVVVSGEAEALGRWEAAVQARGARTRRLKVSHAFHSKLMEPMLSELRAVASGLELAPPRVAIVSNVTGVQLTAEQATSPDYWARHVREAVRFADGVRFLEDAGVRCFVELGPDATLSALAHEC
ncbi:MAG: SDR family NAD(P)-dependent oxidoreductase, partial [Acidobacteriota bacterium]|nr:SDR family NAD(P)-dependent oxidoreductase [Acidobacteriota bacterium]